VSRKAFTLIELLVAIAITFVFLAGFGAFYAAEQRSFAESWIDVDVSEELRTALEQILRDVRSADLDPTDAGNCGILIADANELEFLVDVDPFEHPGCDPANPAEHKGFKKEIVGGRATIETYLGGLSPWEELAEDASPTEPLFTYQKPGSGGLVPVTSLPASPADRSLIERVDVRVTMERRSTLGRFRRTESGSAVLRNRCL
jgi:prepilin-type N-terminal cleavage/methylation domain-containing protein